MTSFSTKETSTIQSPFEFSTPQASSTKRPLDFTSQLSEEMSTVHIDVTEFDEMLDDPLFSTILSDLINGIPVESETDYTKFGLIELFDRLCMKEQERYRKLMKSQTEAKDLSKM